MWKIQVILKGKKECIHQQEKYYKEKIISRNAIKPEDRSRRWDLNCTQKHGFLQL